MTVIKPHALLIHGSEQRFVDALQPLAAYGEQHFARTELIGIGTARETVRSVQDFMYDVPGPAATLIAFCGHGSRKGWESTGWWSTSYRHIAKVLAEYSYYDILVINDTCYGHHFRSALDAWRGPVHTGLISPWEAEGVVRGSLCVDDACRFWPQHKSVEDKISAHIYANTDTEVPVQLRWGAELNHLFFPTETPEPPEPPD